MKGTISELIKKALNKDIRAISQCISIVENEQENYIEILNSMHKKTSSSYIIGITGPAGSGKSTLVDKLIKLIRAEKKTCGVILVDPSSAFTGGALLGDRIRMQKHSTDLGVFIRSMGTRGSLGGIARKTKDVVKIFSAVSFDYIIIETVGIGQTEIDITKVADIVVLVLMPGGGDNIQVMKAGMLEVADIFVINKADKDGAEQLKFDLNFLLDLGYKNLKKPDIILTIAEKDSGIDELFKSICIYKEYSIKTGNFDKRRKENILFELQELLNAEINKHINNIISQEILNKLVDEIYNKKITPYNEVEKILRNVCSWKPSSK